MCSFDLPTQALDRPGIRPQGHPDPSTLVCSFVKHLGATFFMLVSRMGDFFVKAANVVLLTVPILYPNIGTLARLIRGVVKKHGYFTVRLRGEGG